MGLNLAHHIVEAHHGRLSVESEPGRGSTFTAHFPAAPAAGAATVAAVAPATPRAAEEAR
jgi:signal transduction histidine kinase